MGDKDVSVMTQKEMLFQLEESIENDARLQAELDEMNRRLDRQERTFEKISVELSEQRNFFAALEGLDKKLSELGKKTEEIIDWKHEQEKLNLLEQRDNKTVDEKFNRLFNWKDKTNVRLDVLENKSAQTVFSLVKKIGSIVLGLLVTAVVSFLFGKMK